MEKTEEAAEPPPPPQTPPTTDGLTPAEQDEMTIKQIQDIEGEITETTPLISGLLPFSSTLLPLYTTDPVYTKKIHVIAQNFQKIRRIKPDGSCFYRAVLYRLFEAALDTPTFQTKLDEKFAGFKELLKEAGYTQFTVDDFYDNFGEALVTLKTLSKTDEEPITTIFFSSLSVCDYLTVFLRILTAAELVKNCSFYSNFLSTEDQSIQEFIKLEVEPMGKEADHLQIIALATALDIGIKVVYMDRGDEVVEHTFPEGMAEYFITLLYRPGHYDVVY